MTRPTASSPVVHAGQPRIEVIVGGRPTPPQLAAMLTALERGDPRHGDDVPAWRLAGLLESVGDRGLEGPVDLRRARAGRRR